MTERIWAVLRRLAETEAPLDGETSICNLCNEEIPLEESTIKRVNTAGGAYGQIEYDNRLHLPLCPWREARELLGMPLVEVRFTKDGHPLRDDPTRVRR